MPSIKLMSYDHEVFEVDLEIAKMSTTIKMMLDVFGIEDDDDEAIPLPKVKGSILKMVIEWCTFHKHHPPHQKEDNKSAHNICSWDTKFLNVHKSIVFELAMAADYLVIEGLMDATCKTIANLLMGESVDQLRKTFNIKNDFLPPEQPAEEEQVQEEREISNEV